MHIPWILTLNYEKYKFRYIVPSKEWISQQTDELVEQRKAAKAKRGPTMTRLSFETYRKLDVLVK